ncbi:hypothetical protein ncot_06215 [Nocardioides sp. JQ2195]|uniref:hypothetical protein n=1 Tax=Nocardioides sp. JQ2195 TaxID=2592334 RepID=UPI00143E1ACB|nr:hypothetical protein [Nocardioides sp. JQ2195]QIX26243.1 hypothetical protein ncot_06215 [Nocardioides sp. JQ2195]
MTLTTNPDRRRWRNRLFLVGLLPLLLSLLFFGKVALMLDAHASGEDAYGSDSFGRAADEFARNQRLNVIEPWIASFNEGTADHQDEKYDDALDRYDAALADVPDDRECVVRTNMALAHEAIGDRALEEEQKPDAVAAWQDGIAVMAEADCPTDAAGGDEQTEKAAAVDARLRQKLEEQHAPEKKQEKDQEQDREKQQQEQEKLEKKKQKIEQRNAEGREKRAESKQYEDYPYSGSDNGPQW